MNDTRQSANRAARRFVPAIHSTFEGLEQRLVFSADVQVVAAEFVFDAAPTRQTIQLTFNANVAQSFQNQPVMLENLTTGQAVPQADLQVEFRDKTNIGSITFDRSDRSSSTGDGSSHIFPDGNYRLTLPAGSIQDNQGNTLATSFTFDFFALAGDANRDRVVDVTDLGILATNWQKSSRTFSQGDFNYDGNVDVTDLGILATNWQKNLPPPPPATASALSAPTIATPLTSGVTTHTHRTTMSDPLSDL